MDTPPPAGATRGRAGQSALLVVLHAYLLIQLALPWRHWLYEGDVNWTEAGHRFSWRMKLRDKEVELGMYVVDPTTGERDLVDIEEWLTDRQIMKMAGTPDMLLQFAHFLADRYEAETGVRPIIRAEAFASLNGGPYRYLLNPELDLASQPIGLLDPPW